MTRESEPTFPQLFEDSHCVPNDIGTIVTDQQDAAEKDALMHDPDSLSHLKFQSAATKWLGTKKEYLDESTYKMYEHHIKSLNRFFGHHTPATITLGTIRMFQLARRDNTNNVWRKPCGPSIINHEMSIIQQLLRHSGQWKRIGTGYKPLRLPRFTPKKTMTDEEEDFLFQIGESDPEFELPLMVAYLSVNTTACGKELRSVKLEHITLNADPPRLLIAAKTAKNGYRGRVIPLNETATATIRKCLARAHALGSVLPSQYLFPKRITTGYWNPDKPASPAWLSKRWKALREAAGLPWLTPHCLRHMAITRMLEFGVPEETVRNIAGHVSVEMMRHYSHARVAANAKALDVIDPRHRKTVKNQGSYDPQKKYRNSY